MSDLDYIQLLNFGNMSYERLNLSWEEVAYCVEKVENEIAADQITLRLKSNNQTLFLGKGESKSHQSNLLIFDFQIPGARIKSEILVDTQKSDFSNKDLQYLKILSEIILKLIGLKNCQYSPFGDLRFKFEDTEWRLEKNYSCELIRGKAESVFKAEFCESFWISVDANHRGKFIYEMNNLLKFKRSISFDFDFYDFKNNKIVTLNRIGEIDKDGNAHGTSSVLKFIENIKIKKFVESLNSGVIVFDDQSEVVEVNELASQILNLPINEIEKGFFFNGDCIIKSLDNEEIRKSEFPSNKVERSNTPVIGEIIGIERPGDPRIQWLKCSAIFQYFGGKRFTLFTFVDASAQVNNSEELSKFFNLSLNLLCIANVDGTFEKINPQFRNLLGFEDQEILSTPILDFVHPEDKEKTIKALEQLGEGREVVNFENRYLAKDNSLKYIAWAAAPEKSTGKIYAVGVNRTEERMKEKNATKISQLRNLYISNRVKSFEFWNKTLSLILEVTESKFGFLGK